MPEQKKNGKRCITNWNEVSDLHEYLRLVARLKNSPLDDQGEFRPDVTHDVVAVFAAELRANRLGFIEVHNPF